MAHWRLRTLAGILGCWFCVFQGVATVHAAPDITRMWFTPTVVPETYTQPVRFEATVSENPASVAFEYDGVDRAMHDDGTNGDRVAGDGTWTILFSANEILRKLSSTSVFRPFIGYCKPAGGARFNIFAEVWTSSIGLTTVRPLDALTQESDYVVNFVVSSTELLTSDYRALATRFYDIYPDDFDFLNFVHIAGPRGNRFHLSVKNDVSGLGLSLFDNTAQYGSGGRMKGINAFPLPTFFDTASLGFVHETGHQWINFLHGTPFASGSPHWPKGDIAINVMGVSLGAGGVGGNYSWTFTPDGQGGYVVGFNQAPNINTSTFNSMELYLMGLIPENQVGTFFVLQDQNQNVVNGQVLQPGEILPVTVRDVIDGVGPRIPESASSPKAFRVATIILSEQALDVYAMALYDWFARRAEETRQLRCEEGLVSYSCNPFNLATGGRATMVSRLNTSPPSSDDSCTTPDPFVTLGGGTCCNGGWLPPGMVCTTPTPPPPPPPPPPDGACTTPDPFVTLGGGTCCNGGWLPPGMVCTTPTPPPPPPPPPPDGACTTPDPFVVLGGGTCCNGGWLPPGMACTTPTPPPPPPPPPDGACTTPDPFVALGGGTCCSGGWLPPGMVCIAACQYSVTPVEFSPCMPGGSVTATVTTQAGCPWTVEPNASWLTIPSGSSGSGSGTIAIAFSANYDAPRDGIVMVRWPTPTAGQNIHVAQAGCFYAVSQDSFSFASAGGTGTFNVIQQSEPIACGGATQDSCIWTAFSDVPWITVTSSMPRAGDNPVAFTVAANTGPASRTGRITVRDQVVEITQAGM